MATKLNETEKTLRKLEKISGRPLTLGNLLWSIRKCEEMTQEEFGELLGVSKSYISDLENTRKFASPIAAARYAEKLGYPVDQFIRLCLQEQFNKEGIKVTIQVEAA